MSQENVEIVGRSIDALNRRDLEAFVELTTSDYELFPAMTGFAGAAFRGREGVERYFEELGDAWEEFRVVGEEFRDLGDRVLVLMRVEGRGRGSGIPVDARQAIIVDFRGGKVSRTRSYLDRAEALRAVGSEEQAVSANVELVRVICAPWAHGDFSSTEWVHPEIEFVIADGPAPGRWTGLDGLIEGFRQVLSAYDDYHTVADELRELDNERVLEFHHYSGRGKTSGLDVGQIAARGADIFNIRDRKVTRLAIYFDRSNAIADLGLEE